MKREFSINSVISVVTGYFVCRSMDEVWDICNYLTRNDLFTHQLVSASKDCEAMIVEQHPWLKEYIPLVENVINDWKKSDDEIILRS